MINRAVSNPRSSLYVSPYTDTKKSARLQNSQTLVASGFISQLPDPAWVVDEEGHLLNASDAFFKTFRLNPETSINQLLISLIPHELWSRLTIQHRVVFSTCQSLRTDILVSQEHQSLTYHAHLFPLAPVAGRRVLAGIATITRGPSPATAQAANKTNDFTMPAPEVISKALQAERTRIGHELHDNVNQILSSAALYLDALKPVNDHQQMVKGKGREYILLAIEEIRNLSRRLAAPYLDTRQFCEKIKALVNDVKTTTSLNLSYALNFSPDKLSPGKKLAIFRIVQEQVKNILTHSKATAAAISIIAQGAMIELSISDNGAGFEKGRLLSGVGMSSIRQRVAEYSGNMDLQTSPGSGCKLLVRMPIDHAT